MNLSENVTWTDILTLFLLFVTVLIFIISVIREKRKANDLLQAKNYYFLSLMLQIQKKKLTSSFSDFAKALSLEGQENFYLKLYPTVESTSIKNFAVDDLLKYYSEPVYRKSDVDVRQIQMAWFYSFEYCQLWEGSQQDAVNEQNDIDKKGKAFYNDFMVNYDQLNVELITLTLDDFILMDRYNHFYNIIQRHRDYIDENKKLPSMHSIFVDYYKPLWESMINNGGLKLDKVKEMLINGQSIYGAYWSYIKEKAAHFTHEVENQHRAELEFDKSITNLINYSIQHSTGEFKDMYKALAQQIKVKP